MSTIKLKESQLNRIIENKINNMLKEDLDDSNFGKYDKAMFHYEMKLLIKNFTEDINKLSNRLIKKATNSNMSKNEIKDLYSEILKPLNDISPSLHDDKLHRIISFTNWMNIE